jgi:hypothetical protein
MSITEELWHPPEWCLLWLTGFVTLLAVTGVVVSTVFVSSSLSSGEPPLVGALALWLFYAAVSVTCFKAMVDWIKNT